jgi:inhibitor of cysteine peptidase
MNRRWLVVLLVVVAVACRTSDGGITIDQEADGTTITLAVGDVLEVALPANPTTGFTWEVTAVDGAILSAAGDYVFVADSTAVVGSGGTMTFSFDVLAPGTTTLEMVYHRTFESEPPADTFTVTVTVE